MTVIRSLLGGFVRFVFWLCYGHQWTELELLAIAGVTVVLLLLILIRLRKRPVRSIAADQIREGTPIIGVNLAEYNLRRQAGRSMETDRAARVSQTQERPKNWKQITRQFAKSNEQIRRLQHELAKRRQSESYLEQKLAELKEANKRLNDEIARGKPTAVQSELQVTDLKTTVEQLRDEISRRKQAEAYLEQQVAELKSRCEQAQPDEAPTEGPEQASKSKRLEEPLSIEELRKVSALAKRVSGRVSSDTAT
ncbi:MAG: hypothetical protein ABIF19_21590 [Planctomycetota bacterium]